MNALLLFLLLLQIVRNVGLIQLKAIKAVA